MSQRGALRQCPECRQAWPHKSADHDLRGFGWLSGLPRNVSVSNVDCLIHDFSRGDRFLMLEVKMPWEPELQVGQSRLLRAAAALPGFTVRLLHAIHGEVRTLRYHRVERWAVDASGVIVPRSDFRDAVAYWLEGNAWSDPRGEVEEGPDRPAHVHGWARTDGVWRCVQDHYAMGFKPETGCNATWDEAHVEGVA